jgi:mRNA interferase RelE/StbE
MSYRLEFTPRATKAWKHLDEVTREQFRKKLKERLDHPRVPKDAMHFGANHYKIKLKEKGYRLVYQVDDHRILVLVVEIGRRDRIYDQF